METQIEKVIDLLNKLIEVNNDRIAEYKLAKSETRDPGLKNIFQSIVRESLALRKELADEVIALGASPTQSRASSGNMFRVWMDIKVAITGKNLKTILSSCAYGETAVLGMYEEALKANFPVPVNILDFLITQKYKVHRAQIRIQEMLEQQQTEKQKSNTIPTKS